MSDFGIKRIVQGTPAGYLAELHDGSQRLFPESVLVNAGLVGPTEGLVAPQLPGPGSMDDIAPPAYQGDPGPGIPLNPTPEQKYGPAEQQAVPTSDRVSVSGKVGGQQLVRRNDVQLDTTPYESVTYDQAIAEAEARRERYGDLRSGYLEGRATAEQGASEALYGRPEVGPDGQPVVGPDGMPVWESEGLAQKEAALAESDARQLRVHDHIADRHVAQRQAELQSMIAEVPTKDPTSYWHRGGKFQAAVGAMAGIFGGILAVTMGTGRNMGLEAIDEAINDDLEAQESLIQSEWKKIAAGRESLQEYQDFQARKRQRILEGQLLRRESVKQHWLAKAATFNSKAKQLEILEAARALDGQQEKDLIELLHREREWGLAVSQDAFNREATREKLSLEKISTYAQASLARAQAAKLKAEAEDETKAPLVRIGELPVTGEDMFVPRDIADGMTKEQLGELVKAGANASNTAEYGQQLLALAAEGRRIYDGPLRNNRAVVDEYTERLRAAWKNIQFDELVKRTGLTATDKAMEEIVQIVNGTGSPPTKLIGSGSWKAFEDFVTRSIETDARDLTARKVILSRGAREGELDDKGQPRVLGTPVSRTARDFGKTARNYAEAAGKKHDALKDQDPFAVANAVLGKIQGGRTDDVLEALELYTTANSKNSVGDVENQVLAGTLDTVISGGGAVVPAGKGTYQLNKAPKNAQSAPDVLRSAAKLALLREKDPKKRVKLQTALTTMEDQIKPQYLNNQVDVAGSPRRDIHKEALERMKKSPKLSY